MNHLRQNPHESNSEKDRHQAPTHPLTLPLSLQNTTNQSRANCHSERSEESTSQPVTLPSARFFAALRMTGGERVFWPWIELFYTSCQIVIYLSIDTNVCSADKIVLPVLAHDRRKDTREPPVWERH